MGLNETLEDLNRELMQVFKSTADRAKRDHADPVDLEALPKIVSAILEVYAFEVGP